MCSVLDLGVRVVFCCWDNAFISSLMVEPLASDVYEEDEEDEESYDEDFNAEMAFVLDQNYLG